MPFIPHFLRGSTFRGFPTRIWARALFLLALPTLLLAPAAPAAALDRVVLRLLWRHQAQFAGIYLAQDAGIYRQYGLEVEVKPSGPGISPLGELQEGKCDFALTWLTDALTTCDSGGKVVNLAQLLQRSAMLLVAHADEDITRISELAGRRVSLWDAHISLAAKGLFRKANIQIKEIRQGAGMALFLDRAVSAASAMRYNELHQLYQSGLDLDDVVIFDLAELGFNFPEDGLYTTEDNWSKRPELCRRFTQATLDGWRLSFDRPDEALAAVMKRVDQARLASNAPHQRWMLRTMQELMTSGVSREELGRLTPETVRRVEMALRQQGLIHWQVNTDTLLSEAWRKKP
ncbi:MAG: ABC transporter substrate-binding protein [Deltaproteobacteria bacterium]|nr:ABC transporter substrate-binding protein [Deltaproteobacteria bacterium]